MDPAQVIGSIASAVGRGLAAGLVGTAVMTLSQLIEMRLTGRTPSTTPAQAAGRVLGVQPRGPAEAVRFTWLIHWAYGTLWGSVRGLLAVLGLRGFLATAAHFALIWGSAVVLLPGLGVAPPVWRWGLKTIAIDIWHHAVYVVAVGVTYEWLSRAA
jgi:hypothetical protein